MTILLTWLLGWSVVTFGAYGYDKMQAKRGAWRVPEVWLHAMALAGGFAGGWAGMFVFRHKTRKWQFKVVLAISTVVWLWVLFRWGL